MRTHRKVVLTGRLSPSPGKGSEEQRKPKDGALGKEQQRVRRRERRSKKRALLPTSHHSSASQREPHSLTNVLLSMVGPVRLLPGACYVDQKATVLTTS